LWWGWRVSTFLRNKINAIPIAVFKRKIVHAFTIWRETF
jgi:hypothetical protein